MDSVWFKLRALYRFWEIISKGKTFDDFILARSVQEFERRLTEYCGATYALGVASGTDALILSLKAYDIGPGDEVIVPAIGFFSVAGAVAWVNAKPVFVDIEERSWNINPAEIEQAITPRTKAIIPVHLNGRMADMEPIAQLAKRKSLVVIEDAAHALGSKYKERSPGYYGDIACLSFNPTKILGGYGDGGVVLTNHQPIAEKISWLRRYGSRLPEFGIDHPVIGVASRLGSFQAAVLNTDMDAMDTIVRRTRENYFLYAELLAGIEDLKLPEIPPPEYFINGYRFTVRAAYRDQLRKLLRDNGTDARMQYGVPLPHFEAFKYLRYEKGSFPVTEKLASECLVLPTHDSLSRERIAQISDLIKRFFVEIRV